MQTGVPGPEVVGLPHDTLCPRLELAGVRHSRGFGHFLTFPDYFDRQRPYGIKEGSEAGFRDAQVYWEGINHKTGHGNNAWVRRERAESRLQRERKRNAWLAVGGFMAAAVALGLGIHNSLSSPAPAQLKLDPETAEFYRTPIGHVLLTFVESGYCRELRFDNNSGRFSDGGRYRCFIDNEPTINPGVRPIRISDAEARAGTINGFFKKR